MIAEKDEKEMRRTLKGMDMFFIVKYGCQKKIRRWAWDEKSQSHIPANYIKANGRPLGALVTELRMAEMAKHNKESI